jgi:hypothetical protein
MDRELIAAANYSVTTGCMKLWIQLTYMGGMSSRAVTLTLRRETLYLRTTIFYRGFGHSYFLDLRPRVPIE